jgi:hypothetical protein
MTQVAGGQQFTDAVRDGRKCGGVLPVLLVEHLERRGDGTYKTTATDGTYEWQEAREHTPAQAM